MVHGSWRICLEVKRDLTGRLIIRSELDSNFFFIDFQSYFQVLESYNGKPMDPHFLTMKAIANIIFSIVSGNRNDYSDEYFNEYVRSMTEGFEILGESGILMVFPFLK